jgi:hypothetical protein
LPAPVPSPAPGPPRLKKKIPWKGKNILVQLPWDDERGQLGKAPTPMTQKDVDAMVREWEQLGYDTTGFNLGPNSPDAEEGGQGQSRGIWPYDQDMLNERAQRSFRVSIPDRRGEFRCFPSSVLRGSLGFSEDEVDLHSVSRNCIPSILLDVTAKPPIEENCLTIFHTLPSICHL